MEPRIICPALKNLVTWQSGDWEVEDLLLPHLNINGSLIDWLDNPSNFVINENDCVGIFAADPFAYWNEIAEKLHARAITRVCNFPALGFHDRPFRKFLKDGGVGQAREQKRLAWFKAQGFEIIWCSDHYSNWKIADFSPDLCVLIDSPPQISSENNLTIAFHKGMIVDG